MSDIEYCNPNGKLNNKNICSNVLKMEILWYGRTTMIFLNAFLNLKSKYFIKDAIAQIEKQQGTLICESISSESFNIKKVKPKPNN